jgi:hypothetical protein
VPETSQPPPPPAKGGNLKYILIGLLFLGAGGVISWIAAGNQQPPPAAAPPPAPEPQRANPLADQNLVLEEEKPAEEPKQPEPEPTPAHKGKGGGKAGDWECSGDLPEPMKVINENYAQIRSCYERRLKVNNILQGELNLKLKIGSTGKVVASSIAGSLHDSEVFNCVKNLAQLWTFSAPTGGNCAVLQAPFKFSPKQ